MPLKKISDLQAFLARCNERHEEKFGKVESEKENVLGSFTKLVEEVGELAEQIHKRRGRQDARKGTFVMEDLESELADVIFAATMLSVDLGFDLETALVRKKEKLEKKLG